MFIFYFKMMLCISIYFSLTTNPYMLRKYSRDWWADQFCPIAMGRNWSVKVKKKTTRKHTVGNTRIVIFKCFTWFKHFHWTNAIISPGTSRKMISFTPVFNITSILNLNYILYIIYFQYIIIFCLDFVFATIVHYFYCIFLYINMYMYITIL